MRSVTSWRTHVLPSGSGNAAWLTYERPSGSRPGSGFPPGAAWKMSPMSIPRLRISAWAASMSSTISSRPSSGGPAGGADGSARRRTGGGAELDRRRRARRGELHGTHLLGELEVDVQLPPEALVEVLCPVEVGDWDARHLEPQGHFGQVLSFGRRRNAVHSHDGSFWGADRALVMLMAVAHPLRG